MRTRRAVRAAASGALALAVVGLSALPASAAEGLGDRKPTGLTPLDTVLIFIGIPVLVFAIVIALVYATSRNTEPRLREGQSWWTEPDYNTRESVGVQQAEPATDGAQARTTDGGGTSAGW